MTVHDPSGDVLTSGDEASGWTRGRVVAVAVVAALVAAGVGVAEVRDALEQRRLDRVVDLAASVRGSTGGNDPVADRVDVSVVVELDNRGPRPLVLEGGSLGSYALVNDRVEIDAGGSATVRLLRSTSCASRPPTDLPGPLVLDVRTAAGVREVALPLDTGLDVDGVARTCGYVPLPEAASFTVSIANRPERDVLELVVEVLAATRDPVRLTAVDAAAGVEVRAALGGRPLPAALPPRGADPTSSPLVLRLTVRDCRAARGAAAQLVFTLADQDGRDAQTAVDYAPAVFEELVSDVCPG